MTAYDYGHAEDAFACNDWRDLFIGKAGTMFGTRRRWLAGIAQVTHFETVFRISGRFIDRKC
jgi:hypothetical protein